MPKRNGGSERTVRCGDGDSLANRTDETDDVGEDAADVGCVGTEVDPVPEAISSFRSAREG